MSLLLDRQSVVDSRAGWLTVAGAFAANLVTFGILFSFGVILTPLAETFDTTTGPVATVFSGSVFVYYLAGVVGGRLSDRLGVRPVTAIASVLLPAGLLLTSWAPSLPWAMLFYVPLVGVGVGFSYSPMLGGIGRLFDRRRSMAIGLVLAGVATGTLAGPLLLRVLIDEYGWRPTFRIVAVGAFVILALGSLSFREPRPATTQQISIRHMSRSRNFRTLYLSAIVISPGFYAPLAFLNDYAISRDIGAGAASALVGVSGAFSVVVRLVAGSVGDRFDALGRYQLSYLLMSAALAVWLFSGGSYALLVVCALLHGAGWAVWVTATPTVLASWFGVAQLGGLLGLFYTGLGIGAPLGPAVSGFIIDRWSYRPAVAVALVTSLLACGLTFFSSKKSEPA